MNAFDKPQPDSAVVEQTSSLQGLPEDNQVILRTLATCCALCDQVFSKRSLLVRHLRQHNDNAPQWSAAAAQAAQMEEMHKQPTQCYWRPIVATKHCCTIFLNLHGCRGTRPAMNDSQPALGPPPPLKLGTAVIFFQNKTLRMRLSQHCCLSSTFLPTQMKFSIICIVITHLEVRPFL